jgi:hypothetical protein
MLLAGACSSSSSSGAPEASTEDAPIQDVAPNTETGTEISPDGAIMDAALDAAAMEASQDAAQAPTCGTAPARFTLLTGANAGLVQDNVTGLVWMSDSVGGGERVDAGGPQTQTDAAAYCSGRGMRLPTEAEATALAMTIAPCVAAAPPPSQCLCGNGMLPFGQWGTWTSTFASEEDAFVVDYLGDISFQVADNFPSAVLCVRDAPG